MKLLNMTGEGKRRHLRTQQFVGCFPDRLRRRNAPLHRSISAPTSSHLSLQVAKYRTPQQEEFSKIFRLTFSLVFATKWENMSRKTGKSMAERAIKKSVSMPLAMFLRACEIQRSHYAPTFSDYLQALIRADISTVTRSTDDPAEKRSVSMPGSLLKRFDPREISRPGTSRLRQHLLREDLLRQTGLTPHAGATSRRRARDGHTAVQARQIHGVEKAPHWSAPE